MAEYSSLVDIYTPKNRSGLNHTINLTEFHSFPLAGEFTSGPE